MYYLPGNVTWGILPGKTPKIYLGTLLPGKISQVISSGNFSIYFFMKSSFCVYGTNLDILPVPIYLENLPGLNVSSGTILR